MRNAGTWRSTPCRASPRQPTIWTRAIRPVLRSRLSPRASEGGVGGGQRAVQIRDQVVCVLYARRVPHERLGDAHRLALPGAGLDVARGGGRPHGGLDRPEVRRAVCELQARQELLDRFVPAYDGKAPQPTETPHLFPGQL